MYLTNHKKYKILIYWGRFRPSFWSSFFFLNYRVHQTREVVEKAFADDFNTPKAMEAINGLMKSTNQMLNNKIFEKVFVIFHVHSFNFVHPSYAN